MKYGINKEKLKSLAYYDPITAEVLIDCLVPLEEEFKPYTPTKEEKEQALAKGIEWSIKNHDKLSIAKKALKLIGNKLLRREEMIEAARTALSEIGEEAELLDKMEL